jgi:hypothetical protein
VSAEEFGPLVQGFIVFGVMPLWMLSGLADWLCHRHTSIETTTGLKESALHVLMLLEMGAATLAAALFEINALVAAIMLVAFVLHELTVYVDLRYSSARRDIPPVEQLVHSFLEFVPVTAGVLVLLLHWPQVLSLFGLGDQPADFGLRFKGAPLSAPGIWVFAAAMALLVFIPYSEELIRCWRHSRGRSP